MSSSVRTYGNWRKPALPGIGRLGLAGTVTLMGGLAVVILAMMISTALALVAVVLIAIPLVPLTMRDRHGRNGLQWVGTRWAWFTGVLQGTHLYRCGPLGRLPTAAYAPPGLLAGAVISEENDAYGRPFALVQLPTAEHYSVVLACNADGASLVDADQVDTWVAHWGQWLATLAYEPGLVGVSVTIETAPDTGERLRNEVIDNLVEDAPDLALGVLADIVDHYSVGSAEITTRVVLTYSGAADGVRSRRGPRETAEEIGNRLPGIARRLSMTGAGPAVPMTRDDLTRAVRAAYDPQAVMELDEAHSLGVADLDWHEAGPVATQEAWDHYRHDSGCSITWTMTQAPRGEVFSTVLAPLAQPHPDLARKRLTLVYRPHDAGSAARLVERDRKDALFKAQQTSIVQARDSVDLQSTAQAAREEAMGAGLVRFGMFLTATVLDPGDLKLAAATVENLAAAGRITLRRVYGAQAAAFAAALPVGLVMTKHLRTPQPIRDAM
ncbi:hypothetical protein LO772_32100 [Yinghuangia sp. ASG 101]|uniref:SCO6880 family protein n=1 Tax=Yinghuangia sp. ASG 101 TaxID=2896848 RepID=UPI001E6467DD|nr:SCO6880 family protein [Yinghuangia sp. ASG 101]UGQ11385.1 hypothetical protein LO772_32100 [Yinghuangia sp. ASG 101]